MKVTESILKKLKRDLKENQNEAVKFTFDCFDDMLDDDGLIAWLANGVGYKPRQLKQTLKNKKPNKRNSKFTSTDFQKVYDFWPDNSINSNESAYSMKHIKNHFILEQFSNINNPNVIEKIEQLKNGLNVVFTAPRMVYTELDHKLHSCFCQKFTQVSFTVFVKYKPYYCVKPTEKEKLSCLWINCLNPHLLLQSIKIYRKSKGLPSHDSLTEWIDRLNKGESFEEANDDKACKFYSY